jgi:hypothetical protein
MPSPSDQVWTDSLRTLVTACSTTRANPTPCAKWTVRDLTSRLAGGGQMFAADFRGDVVEIDPDAPMPDMSGDDLVGAIDGALAAFEAAASE